MHLKHTHEFGFSFDYKYKIKVTSSRRDSFVDKYSTNGIKRYESFMDVPTVTHKEKKTSLTAN